MTSRQLLLLATTTALIAASPSPPMLPPAAPPLPSTPPLTPPPSLPPPLPLAPPPATPVSPLSKMSTQVFIVLILVGGLCICVAVSLGMQTALRYGSMEEIKTMLKQVLDRFVSSEEARMEAEKAADVEPGVQAVDDTAARALAAKATAAAGQAAAQATKPVAAKVRAKVAVPAA